MKLKKLVQIEKTIEVIIMILAFPLFFVARLLEWIAFPFKWIGEKLLVLKFVAGNKLLKISDEVKNGVIKNTDYIRYGTSIDAYRKLKAEQSYDTGR